MLLQLALPSCFAISDCPDLEGPNYGQIQAALAFAQEIEDFDDLIDPHHLFICFLGLSLLKTSWKRSVEKKKVSRLVFVTSCLFLSL